MVSASVSTASIPVARQFGVDTIVDTATTQFEDVVGEVDLVFDTVGGDRLQRSPAILRSGGRLVSVAAQPSQEAAGTFGIKSQYFVVSPNREQLVGIAKLVDDGKLEPVVAEVFPLSRARAAFERSMLHHGAGKIVLLISQE